MGTSLIASLATHCSISRYVTSLLAPKSHSSHREQNASLIAQSSSFFLLAQETTAFAHLLGGLVLGLRPCSGAGNPHPLRSMLIDVCVMFAYTNINGVAQCQDSRSPSKVPYHCHMQENNIKPPPQEVPHKNTMKIPHIGKRPGTSMFYTTRGFILTPPLPLTQKTKKLER